MHNIKYTYEFVKEILDTDGKSLKKYSGSLYYSILHKLLPFDVKGKKQKLTISSALVKLRQGSSVTTSKSLPKEPKKPVAPIPPKPAKVIPEPIIVPVTPIVVEKPKEVDVKPVEVKPQTESDKEIKVTKPRTLKKKDT